MRTQRLGTANLALVSLYFAPAFGSEAIRALLSPYRGLEDRVQAAAAAYVGRLFDAGLNGLTNASSVLAGIKLVIAAGFLAYLIEFARALAVGREVDRSTRDVVLLLAVGAIAVWALPPLALTDGALIRLCASQLVLVAGAVVVIMIERQIEQSAQSRNLVPAVAQALT
jgi:hypothetical protein